MTENKLSYNYGVLSGRIETLLKYCKTATVVDKDVIMAILDLPIENIYEEEPF